MLVPDPATTTRRQIILEKERRWRRRLYRLFPDYRFSNDVYEALIQKRLNGATRWVDLGCGRNDLVQELGVGCALALGVDRVLHPLLRPSASCGLLRADLCRLPLASASLEIVTGNMVLEHLPDPHSAFQEIHRILKPGGRLVMRTPNSLHPLSLITRLVPAKLKAALLQRLFGTQPEDLFPAYYRANRPRSLRRLCRASGLMHRKVQGLEDVHTAFSPFFFLSLLYYLIVRSYILHAWRTNFILIADQPAKPKAEE